MQGWRLLNFEYSDAPSNLAFEEAVARQVGAGKSPPTLRFWRNRRAAMIGENQSVRLELHLDACRDLGVEVVRRFTGGGAVYHDLGNVNYSVCAPKPFSSSFESQQTLFSRSLECAVTCLKALGVDSTGVPVNTVTVHGRKISGGAGAVRWGAIFYHGSILANTDLEIIWKILKHDQPMPAATAFVQSTRLPVSSLEVELGREVDIEDVKRALRDAFTRTLSPNLIIGSPTQDELTVASELVKEKYGKDEWNMKM